MGEGREGREHQARVSVAPLAFGSGLGAHEQRDPTAPLPSTVSLRNLAALGSPVNTTEGNHGSLRDLLSFRS